MGRTSFSLLYSLLFITAVVIGCGRIGGSSSIFSTISVIIILIIIVIF